MIQLISTKQLACPKFPYGTPVDENGCPGTLCPYYGKCPSTLPQP